MIKDLKYFDGQLQPINRVPDDLKSIYSTCFEIDTRWLVEAAARRQKWIDQSQSLNLYIPDSDGKKLDSAYKLAWIRGLKTTYYLRSLGATHVEKSTSDNSGSNLNAVKSDEEVKQCLIDDPECEACQWWIFTYPISWFYVIAIVAMVFVIIKLNKLEKDRLLAMDADRQIKGDKNV